MPAVHRLNHAVLYVSDVPRSVAFYRDLLGFKVLFEMPKAAFLKAGESNNDHDLGLFQVSADDSRRSAPRPGLYHLAWQVDTIDDLAAIRQVLLDAGSLVGESDHGASKSLYAHDPDGIEFEVMWAVPRSEWPVKAGTSPLMLEAEIARWSGTSTIADLTAPDLSHA